MALIAYYRVSTAKQGISGLGLDAQKDVVRSHAARTGGKIVAEFIEVESGKKSDRPQLAFALAECKRGGHTLVIAKLDRLARNVAFIANMMDAGVDFHACDLPMASRLTLHILAAVAENEARAISDRTKAALAAKKAQGHTLGGFKAPQSDAAKESMRRTMRDVSLQRDRNVLSTITALAEDGKSHSQIAKFLNQTGNRTANGLLFDRQRVGIIIRRNK